MLYSTLRYYTFTALLLPGHRNLGVFTKQRLLIAMNGAVVAVQLAAKINQEKEIMGSIPAVTNQYELKGVWCHGTKMG